MSGDLLFLAGHRAYERIRENGLEADDVEMVVGASGAAKWLVLHGLESELFGSWFPGRSKTLHLYGTSIGSWKSAAAGRQNPLEGFDTLAHAYIHQYYNGTITREQVARETERIIGDFLGPGVPEEILAHPYCKIHLSAVRCSGALASDSPKIEIAGLAGTWLINRLSRKLFKRLCDPTLFYHPDAPPPFIDSDEFSGGKIALTAENFRKAILASGSIPCVMDSVRNIPGAPSGAYRDGGLYHYHPAFDFLNGREGIVLYPHFYDTATLGWLDKNRPSRIADGKLLTDVLMLAPSPEFIADLPLGRIPDRRDFERLAGRDDERVAFWEKSVEMSARLGREFLKMVESGRIREVVKRIP
ncbi:patatin-like phospholipase family protein [Desulfosediminicola flagellatus]|uniref:patatin-like phospholipase family protein n=1 Tax=Desulfosediminicola flagellatus TaxID=2569541 RepID=UPI0010AD301B|nr:patatin-like phospholipase family protein [Desulfosediminicola flagellatus]